MRGENKNYPLLSVHLLRMLQFLLGERFDCAEYENDQRKDVKDSRDEEGEEIRELGLSDGNDVHLLENGEYANQPLNIFRRREERTDDRTEEAIRKPRTAQRTLRSRYR